MNDEKEQGERPGEAEFLRCEHYWSYHRQPDMRLWVGVCMICGYLNGPDLERQVSERVEAARTAVSDA